jgi:hypothetical protein
MRTLSAAPRFRLDTPSAFKFTVPMPWEFFYVRRAVGRIVRNRKQRDAVGTSSGERLPRVTSGVPKMASYQFTDVIAEVQKAPQNQRTDKLIEGIAKQMQQSGNTQLQQFGQELATAKPQLVRACQQQQG